MTRVMAQQLLHEANSPNAANEARWLADHARASGLELSALIARRLVGEPLAYITQSQPFMAHDFTVAPGVLIPREDTAVVVAAAENYLKTIEAPTIIEIGIGSGIIACSLLQKHPTAQVHATDISEKALACATQNADMLGVTERLFLHKQPTLAGLPQQVDCVISNPPYIETATLETLEPHVKNHEPHTALDGGEDGLDDYRWIIPAAFTHLKKGGLLALEIGFNQKESVSALCQQAGFESITCQKDAACLDRAILTIKP